MSGHVRLAQRLVLVSNTLIMRLFFPLALLVFSVLACGRPAPLPPVAGPNAPDAEFPVAPRPRCTEEATAAVASADPAAIPKAAARGVTFNCVDPAEDQPGSSPLDWAVARDRPDRVRALLAAGANPNARWFYYGDRLPLQEAIECHYAPGLSSNSCRHGGEMVRLLLKARADPNAGWCPFESRGPSSCTSAHPVTPLMAAASSGQADILALLISAAADPWRELPDGGTALSLATTGPAIELLATRMFPDPIHRDALALRHLSDHRPWVIFVGPWNSTPLGLILTQLYPPPPPPPPGGGEEVNDRVDDRVDALLDLGADPNQRVSDTGQWPPLALAIRAENLPAVVSLLGRGADPNARWCMPVPEYWKHGPLVVPAGCDIHTGTTPLMFAAELNAIEIVKVLISTGARPDLRDWRGRTALDYPPPATREGIAKIFAAQDRSQ
jgi:ankyrin repeat protein